MEFAEQITFSTSGSTGEVLTLCGCGARIKFMITGYHVGLYMALPRCGEQLERYRNISGDQLLRDRAFWELLIDSQFTKAFRIVLAMNLSGIRFSDGLAASLVPALKVAARLYHSLSPSLCHPVDSVTLAVN